jgi:flagellar hook-associated protein 1 FlgK
MAAAIGGASTKQQSWASTWASRPAMGAPLFSVGAPSAARGQQSSATAAAPSRRQGQRSATPPSCRPATTKLTSARRQRNYALTRLSDGNWCSPHGADGDTVDGFKISWPGAPAAGDRFLLQPVGAPRSRHAARAGRPNGIAAASPVTGPWAATTPAPPPCAVSLDRRTDPSMTPT